MKIRLSCAVLVICFLVAMAPEGQAADVIKLKFNNYFPATHFVSTFSAQFCDEVKKRTNGQVEISHFAGGTLTPPPRVFDGVVQGISDLGMTTLGYTRGRFPVLEILEMPFGYTSGWVASSVANDFYRTFKPKEFDSVHVLFFHCVGPLAVSTVKKPVNTLEELKGLKIRAISRYADMMKYLGASPVPLEIGDIYEALRRGTLDGTLVTLEGLKGFRLGEIIRYATATSKTGGSGGISVVMNRGKWDSLPADIKKVFDDLSAEFSEKYAVQWNQTDIDGREFLKSQGGTVIYLTDAEAAKWTQSLQPVVLDYKKGLMAKGYSEKEIDGYISFMKERIGYWRKMEKERKIPTPYE